VNEQQLAFRVSEHYEQVAESYHLQYDPAGLFDVTREYPANYFRLQHLLTAFADKGIKRVIEVGVGEGTPLATLARAGMEVWGFDISEAMVRKSQDRMKQSNQDPERIFLGDIQDPITYAHALQQGQFDGLMAMGVMPHIVNDRMVVKNMSMLLRPGGTAFVEFRNKLFSLFTFNRYTMDFILNDLLAGVDERLKKTMARELETRVRTDLPRIRSEAKNGSGPGYDAVLARFHNPFEVIPLFQQCGFTDVRLHWYHYHPVMPMLQNEAPELFRQEAIKLEHETSGWKGFFLCSAFVVEARKQ
jgi:2-polyprenyl-3-methyl-5-hydroxy-6-metoxy-1,4-benzoquinol methylase